MTLPVVNANSAAAFPSMVAIHAREKKGIFIPPKGFPMTEKVARGHNVTFSPVR